MKKKYFALPAGNDTDILITDTHYYKWLLSKGKRDIVAHITKVEYLDEHDFIVGVTFLSGDDLKTLQYIERHYFRSVCVPNL